VKNAVVIVALTMLSSCSGPTPNTPAAAPSESVAAPQPSVVADSDSGGLVETEDYQPVKVRLAVTAPKMSLQANVLRGVAKTIAKETGGVVSLKVFAGGSLGDELGVIRRMNLGQVEAAGFSRTGIGQILPSALVLESPFFYRSEEQVDCVRGKMQPRFEGELEKKGYVVLGWANLGSVYLFSQRKVESVDDMRKTKPWAQKGDRIDEATFKELGVTPISVQPHDVLTALQSGLIDTFRSTPDHARALQWGDHASFMVDTPLGSRLEAFLIKKEVFDQMIPAHQAKTKAVFQKGLLKLVSRLRKQNDKSIALMQEKGLKRLAIPDAERAKLDSRGIAITKRLTGSVYPAEVLKRAEGLKAKCK